MRVRSNSYNQSPHNHNEPGPLARIPSPDPDHIDGLHPHTRPNGTAATALDTENFIPPFTFEDTPRSDSHERVNPQPGHGLFNLTNMNSSAPALSTMHGHPVPPPLAHRAATTPAKRLAFAANLSIYDTFSPHVYDRRSEPATCNRLTPALAQRIKEELNSYKMEEMEVHAASRVQCVMSRHLVFFDLEYLYFLPARSFSYDHHVYSILDPSFSSRLFLSLNAIPIIPHSPSPTHPASSTNNFVPVLVLLYYIPLLLNVKHPTTQPQACTSPSERRRPCSCFHFPGFASCLHVRCWFF